MDKYDEEVEKLKNLTPEALYHMWNEADSILFKIGLGPTSECGCPSQVVYGSGRGPFYDVSNGNHVYLRMELEKLDLPNPSCMCGLDPDELPKFAEGQRLIDKYVRFPKD